MKKSFLPPAFVLFLGLVLAGCKSEPEPAPRVEPEPDPVPAGFESWQTLTGPDRSFSVAIPAAAAHTDKTMSVAGSGETYNMSQDIAELGEAAYVINSAAYPGSVQVSDPRVNLQAGLDNAARGLNGGRWEEVNWKTVQGCTAVEAVGSNGEYAVRNVSLMKGNRIIALTYAGPLGTERSKDANYFFESLRVAR